MFTTRCRVGLWALVIFAAAVGSVSAAAEAIPPSPLPFTTFFTEGFEGVTPPALPANWEGPMFGSLWQTATSASSPVAVTPRTGSNMLVLSGTPTQGVMQYVWNTTAYDCTNYKDIKIRFWIHQDPSDGDDYAFGCASTVAPGGQLGYLDESIHRQADTTGWALYEGNLREDAWYSNSVWVGIACLADREHTVCFDDVSLIGTPAPPPCDPTEGTTGTTFTITRNGFGRDIGRVSFVDAKASLRVLSWSDTTIECLVSKAPPSGAYDVSVQPKYGQPKVYTSAFTVQPPTIDTVTPDHGALGATITITGHFFTLKAGKIYLRGSGPKGYVARSCKAATWEMNQATGDSAATFLVPKGLNAGSLCDVAIVIKGMPEAVVEDAFTVE